MVFPLANQRSRSSRSTRRQGGSSSSFSGGGGCSLGFGPRGAVSAFGFWSWWILSGSSFHHSVQIHITAVIEQHTATAATNAIVGVVVVSSRHFFDNARCCCFVRFWSAGSYSQNCLDKSLCKSEGVMTVCVFLLICVVVEWRKQYLQKDDASIPEFKPLETQNDL